MESFREKLDEIRRLIDEDVYRKRVLLLCQQQEPRSFDEYSSSGSFRRLEKFESSTYSEVLKAIDLADNNKPVVMKIMRALTRGVIKRMPSVTTRGCQAYNDILNELVVTQALSQLHDGVILNGQPNALYRTHFFCLIHEIKVVSGNLNRQLQVARKRAKTPKAVAPQANSLQSPGKSGQLAAKATTDTAPTNSSRVSSSAPSETTNSELSDTFSSILMSTSRNDLSSSSWNTQNSTISSSASTRDSGSAKLTSKITEKNLSQMTQVNAPNNNEPETQPTAKTSANQADSKKDGQSDVADTDENKNNNNNNNNSNNNKNDEANDTDNLAADDELNNLPEEERMLMESLPHEYVISVMRHDGQPLWWMMTHKKLTPEQLTSVLVQVIVGLAIAENVYLYEHRDLHVSNILIKRTANEHIPFILDGQRYNIDSQGIKATIIDATFSRLTHNGKVYYRDLTSTLRAYGTRRTPPKMSLQNRSYRQMVRLTRNKWEEFTPKTNLIWLTYLCETLMKNDVMKTDQKLLGEIRKIRDYTLKVKTTFDLLACFPFGKQATNSRAPETCAGNKKV